ncbi:ABC transporter permease subunit [Rhizobium leguminosarum bv. viciae]|nr:ABC transporter permease subunit [Rhizobium leguminosarum bv. viciae]
MSQSDQRMDSRQQATPPAIPKATRLTSLRLSKLWVHLANIYRLTIKEMRSIRADAVVLALVAFSFTVAVDAATGASTEATNLSVGIVDEDRSDLSRRIADGLTPPTFQPAVEIQSTEIDAAMNAQRFLFVVEIPPNFQEDILVGRQPSVQLNIDATAIAQAFNGMTYIQNVILNYVTQFVTNREGLSGEPVKMVTRVKFNENLKSAWFTSVMQIINNITMLAIILTGAALIREREQGTVEHLLVMPVVPPEIMLAKILANGIVIVIATGLSLVLVVQWWLQVPIAGSILLFLGGTCLYVFTVAALGILLGTIAATMGQFGLLAVPVILVLMLLSGAMTPMESMPEFLQYLMNIISPTPHFVVFAQGVLYRGADFSIVWPEILAMTVIGGVYFGFALYRFRRAIFES